MPLLNQMLPLKMPRLLPCLGFVGVAVAAAGSLNAQSSGNSAATEAPIRGLVTDASGAPIEGARIRAQPGGGLVSPFNSLRLGSTTSASDGSFRIEEVVYDHTYRLTAKATGYATAFFDLPPLEPGAKIDPVHLVLGRGRQVHGAAVDTDGNPVAEAKVSLLWPLDQSDFRSSFEAPAVATTTNAQGAFVFSAVAPGAYELRLRHPEYVDRPPSEIDVPAGDTDLDLGVLTFVSGGTVHGVVIGADGDAVAGAWIRGQARHRYGGTPRTATADADGRFRLDGLSTDLVDLGVRGAGYPLLVQPGVRVDSEDPVLIELLHGGVVTGRVVDAGGNSAAGVPVRLRLRFDRRSSGSAVLWGPRDMFPRRVTDAEGRFRFDEVPSGTWSAEARKGAEAAKVEAFELTAGAEREIELVLGTPDRLTVIVTKSLGEPVAGATVLVRSEGETRPSGYGRTGGNGEAQVDISPGPAVVNVEHERLRDERRQVELSMGANELRIELHAAAEIAGTVSSHDGAPLALATIEAVTEYSRNNRRHQRNTVSDQDGAFRVTGVEPGSYIVTARSPGHADGGPESPVRVDGDSIEGIEIVLQPEARIVGVVSGLTPSDLTQVEIRAWKDSRSREATPDTEGNFVLKGIGPGTWRVTLTKGVPGSERRVSREVAVDRGSSEVFVELRFEPGFRLSGQVFDTGEPLSGARLGVAGQSTHTDHEGRFVLDGLKPGRLQLRISRPNLGGSQYRSIDLQADLERLRIELDPATATLSGVVVNAQTGQPLSLAHLTAADAATIAALAESGGGPFSPDARSSFSGNDGTFRLELGPTSELVYVSSQGYESTQIRLNVAPGEHREGLVIELQPSPEAPDQ